MPVVLGEAERRIRDILGEGIKRLGRKSQCTWWVYPGFAERRLYAVVGLGNIKQPWYHRLYFPCNATT